MSIPTSFMWCGPTVRNGELQFRVPVCTIVGPRAFWEAVGSGPGRNLYHCTGARVLPPDTQVPGTRGLLQVVATRRKSRGRK
eukprot:3867089-Rhodomonas_salina.1